MAAAAMVESSREEYVYMAWLAEQAGRYEEMLEFMEKVTKGVELLPRGNEEHLVSRREYRAKVEAELCNFCEGILPLIDSQLDSHRISSSAAAESKVFYLKLKGDYHRYIAEFKTGAERKEALENTLLAYKSAQDIAVEELAPMRLFRLEVANKFSLFYDEILNSPDKVYDLAKKALDVASAEFDSCEHEMQLLHDTCRVGGRG